MRCSVATVSELVAATEDTSMRCIEITATLMDVPSLKLAPSQALCGTHGGSIALHFTSGADGLCVTTENTVRDLALYTSEANRVLTNDDSVPSLGTLELRNLRVTGQVQLLARHEVRDGHIEVAGLDIVAADTRNVTDRPHAYGVSVLQGAFTLWNQQTPDVHLTCSLRDSTLR